MLDPRAAYCEWLRSELTNLSTESFGDFLLVRSLKWNQGQTATRTTKFTLPSVLPHMCSSPLNRYSSPFNSRCRSPFNSRCSIPFKRKSHRLFNSKYSQLQSHRDTPLQSPPTSHLSSRDPTIATSFHSLMPPMPLIHPQKPLQTHLAHSSAPCHR